MWKALIERHNGTPEKARTVSHDKVVNTKTEPSQDSEDFMSARDECSDVFEKLGHAAPDERYENIVIQVLPAV